MDRDRKYVYLLLTYTHTFVSIQILSVKNQEFIQIPQIPILIIVFILALLF